MSNSGAKIISFISQAKRFKKNITVNDSPSYKVGLWVINKKFNNCNRDW